MGAGFLVVACGPAIAADGIGGTLIGGVFGLVLGSILLVPFLLGVGVLLVLIWLTKPRGRIGDGRYPDDRYPDDRYPDDRYPDDRYPDDRFPR